MTYMENTYICLAAPLILAILGLKGSYRRGLIFLLSGMTACLLSAYISSYFAELSGADALTEWDGSGIYAIPAGTLTGLTEYGDDPSGTVLCVLQQSRNKDTAAALIGVLQQRFGEGVTDGGK